MTGDQVLFTQVWANLYGFTLPEAIDFIKERFGVTVSMSYVSRIFDNPSVSFGYVYLMQGSSGNIKIGFTTNLEQRARDVARASNQNIKVIFASWAEKGVRKCEHKMHQIFKKKRVHHEWFALNEADIIAAKAFLLKHGLPYTGSAVESAKPRRIKTVIGLPKISGVIRVARKRQSEHLTPELEATIVGKT